MIDITDLRERAAKGDLLPEEQSRIGCTPSEQIIPCHVCINHHKCEAAFIAVDNPVRCSLPNSGHTCPKSL